MMKDYNKRLVEVDAILDYLSEEDFRKIPEEVIQVIKENKNQEYIWEYDETKDLKDQNLNRDTIAILSYLNTEYLLNEEQKKLMKQIYELNEKKMEQQQVEKHKVDDIFKKRETQQQEKEQIQEQSLVEYKESFLKKIINKIKKFFHKN